MSRASLLASLTYALFPSGSKLSHCCVYFIDAGYEDLSFILSLCVLIFISKNHPANEEWEIMFDAVKEEAEKAQGEFKAGHRMQMKRRLMDLRKEKEEKEKEEKEKKEKRIEKKKGERKENNDDSDEESEEDNHEEMLTRKKKKRTRRNEGDAVLDITEGEKRKTESLEGNHSPDV